MQNAQKIEKLYLSLNVEQIFTPDTNPFCINLITDQHNLVIDSKTRVFLDKKYHHQIIYCKINIKISPLATRYICHYNKANANAIERSMTFFPWSQHLGLNILI